MIHHFKVFVIFLFGLAAGSFLNCVIFRLHKSGKGRAFATLGRSYCPHCNQVLAWQDLIPVLSFVLLKGKCRYCKKPISWQYPIVEIATGIVFLISYFLFLNYFLFLIFCLIISCFLIVIFVYDLKHYIIPDKVIYPAIVITLLYRITNLSVMLAPVLAGAGVAGFFAAIVLISRGRWMGVGDIKLGFLMGLLLGWPNILVAMFFAFIFGAIIGTGLIIARKKTLKSEVPFGPFLVSGTFLALFWGQRVINWYLNLFLLK